MANRLVVESGSQLLARLSTRPSLSQLDRTLFPDDLQPGDVVQISGDSGTGKSTLLLHLMTKCLLPKSYQNFDIGGLGVGIILIDTDHNISILKLTSFMEQFILSSARNDTANNSATLKTQTVQPHVEDILKESLGRLFLLKTYSSLQLEMNFHSLDTMSVNNFKKMDLYLKIMLEKLQKCIKDYKIVTIYVKQEYFQSKHGDTKLAQINHKIDLRKSDQTNDLFYAFIDSVQSCCHYSISNKGFTWVVH